MKNKTLWLVAGILQQVFSWGILLIYTIVKYGALVMAPKVAALALVSLGLMLSVWMILRNLKDTADNGYGLAKRTAIAVRRFIPLLFVLGVVVVLNGNLAGIVDLLELLIGGNLIAIPLGLASYYYGPAYIRDTGINRIVENTSRNS